MLIWTESCRIFTNKNNCLINVGDLLFMIAIFINKYLGKIIYT
ncbi:hypothetical protein VL20_4927 [Microcystis panniformis FACHB-1757]|uniref:Uncharacterized protein n=1 Tax=Microcystis panniformis FACHB-1757 TaxID=1638788 RepID=A0A0K1S6P0_9CHRO|nr:hypothetical protein VL20_4927 [Microcystis panniformis FACHB-1757]